LKFSEDSSPKIKISYKPKENKSNRSSLAFFMFFQNAAIFGPFVMSPFILFSGFFVYISDSPWFLRWLFHMSYFKYALHACLQGTYGLNRGTLFCEINQYCHFKYPSKFLKEIEMDGDDFVLDWGILFFIVLGLRLVAYCSLVIRIRYLRK